jgi:hypothetical protein
MRTKTLALSAVLGMLGSASVMAQNVYSVNAVGYINVTMPPGYSIVTCPLIVGTDTEYAATYNGPAVTNDLNVLFNNDVSGGTPYKGATVGAFKNGVGFGNSDAALGAGAGGGWTGGTLTSGPSFGPGSSASQSDIGQGVQLLPGQAVFFRNPNALVGGANMTATFVGTVPSGSLTNILVPGYNLVGSAVPVSGDFVLNSISGPFFGNVVNAGGPGAGYQPNGNMGPANGDTVLFFDPTVSGGHQLTYAGPGATVGWDFGSWSGGNGAGSGNPETLPNGGVSQGFFYLNSGKDKAAAQTINGFSAPAGTELWVETFSVN